MIVPFRSVDPWDRKEMIFCGEKIMSSMVDFCTVTPSRMPSIETSARLGMAERATKAGPMGQAPSKDLEKDHCEVANCWMRDETSLHAV